MLDVKLFEHVLEIPIERAKTLNQRTLIMVLGLTNEYAYFELVDSNPIRYFNSPIMDISKLLIMNFIIIFYEFIWINDLNLQLGVSRLDFIDDHFLHHNLLKACT